MREPVEFVLLTKRLWVEASQYPVLTLLGQAIGSMVLAADALLQRARAPMYVFDTMGYAFSYPILARFGGCKVLSYTHYPMISTDMLNRVIERRPTYNNQATVAGSATLSRAKGLYYKLFARLYGAVGRWCNLTIVNSKWTAAHIDALWGCKSRVVYPAVDTRTLEAIPLGPGREPLCISVAQFRPEKDHELQIRAFAMFCLEWKLSRAQEACPKLVMIGSVRNSGDAAIVARLMALKGELRLSDDEFEIAMNVSYAELQKYLAHARVGLHTMWNEHFGIGIVELMAAGVITIAHDSGGPKMDIVVPWQGGPTGFLATTVEQYAAALHKAFTMDPKDQTLQQRARQSVKRFSEEQFHQDLVALLEPIIIIIK